MEHFIFPHQFSSSQFHDRIWRPRKIVWTKDTLYIARPEGQEIVDDVPLHEVEEVMTMSEEMDPITKSLIDKSKPNKDFLFKNDINETTETAVVRNDEQERGAGSIGLSSKLSLVHANLSNSLQIKTTWDGLNSGKTYYLSTRSSTNPEQIRQSIVSQLRANVMSAQRKAQAKSRFEKSQEKVQTVQSSLAFQVSMAVLIMVVMQPKHFPFSLRKATACREHEDSNRGPILLAALIVATGLRPCVMRIPCAGRRTSS
jgi:hypothetical protein